MYENKCAWQLMNALIVVATLNASSWWEHKFVYCKRWLTFPIFAMRIFLIYPPFSFNIYCSGRLCSSRICRFTLALFCHDRKNTQLVSHVHIK